MLKDSKMQELLVSGEVINVSQCDKEGEYILTNYQSDKGCCDP
jgi:hypothetical protein